MDPTWSSIGFDTDAGEGRLVSDCLAEMSRSMGSVRLELGGLTPATVDEWLRDVLGAGLADDLVKIVHQRTDGNAFFVREVVALLAANDGDQPIADLAARDLPVAVHDVVRRRTSRLDAETQQLLIVAAVVGREFDTDLLATILATSHQRVLELLEPAIDARLIDVDPTRPNIARFSHALVVDALVAELNPIRRARTHADVAHALERRWSTNRDGSVAQLAYHAFAGATAGTASSAVEYSLRAARIASNAHTPDDAVGHLQRALAAFELDATNDTARRVEILTELGLARCAAADVWTGPPTLLEAATLAEGIGDNAAVVRALAHVNADDLWTSLDWGQHDDATIRLIERTLDALPSDDAASRAALLASLAGQTYHLDPPRSSQAAAAAVTAAEQVRDPVLLFRVLLQQYWAEWRPSGNALRTEIAERMLSLVVGNTLPVHFTPLAHLARFTVAYEVGDSPACDHHLRLALATADAVATPGAWSYALYARVSLELLRGHLDEAAATIEELGVALRRSRRFTAAATRAGLRLQHCVEQGMTDEALDEVAVLDSSIYASPIAWFRAWVLAEGGRMDEARTALATYDGPIADDWFKMPLLTAGISAAAASNDAEFVRRHIDELRPMSHMLACTGSGGIVIGPVALALATACRTLGDEEGANAYLATASDLIERMGATPWAERVRAVLRRDHRSEF